MLKTALLLIAASPAFAITLTAVDAEWSVTKIATNEVLCAGAVFSNFSGTVCDSIPELPGFSMTFAFTGEATNTSAYADIQASVNTFFDSSVYAVDLDANVVSVASTLFAIMGGSGPGLFDGFGFAAGGVTVGSTASASGGAAVKNNGCDGPCGLQPFVFGEVFLITATADAHVSEIGQGVGATWFSHAGIIDIFDLDLNPLPRAFSAPVPEPSSFVLMLLAALGAGIKFGVLPIGKLIRVNRAAR